MTEQTVAVKVDRQNPMPCFHQFDIGERRLTDIGTGSSHSTLTHSRCVFCERDWKDCADDGYIALPEGWAPKPEDYAVAHKAAYAATQKGAHRMLAAAYLQLVRLEALVEKAMERMSVAIHRAKEGSEAARTAQRDLFLMGRRWAAVVRAAGDIRPCRRCKASVARIRTGRFWGWAAFDAVTAEMHDCRLDIG